jgi:hypothetical protein
VLRLGRAIQWTAMGVQRTEQAQLLEGVTLLTGGRFHAAMVGWTPVVGYRATDMRQIQRQTKGSSRGRQCRHRLPDTRVIEPWKHDNPTNDRWSTVG